MPKLQFRLTSWHSFIIHSTKWLSEHTHTDSVRRSHHIQRIKTQRTKRNPINRYPRKHTRQKDHERKRTNIQKTKTHRVYLLIQSKRSTAPKFGARSKILNNVSALAISSVHCFINHLGNPHRKAVL